VNTPEA
jgi:hydroxymethylglutaryl-CoA reductase (NADPH)